MRRVVSQGPKFFAGALLILMALRMAARRSGLRTRFRGFVHGPGLRNLRLMMWVVGVAYGLESLEVTRSRRSLRFFFGSTESSPSTSVSTRCRFRTDGDELDSRMVRGKMAGGIWVDAVGAE